MFKLFNNEPKTDRPKSKSLDVVDFRDADSHCLISGNLQIIGDVHFSGTLRIDGRVNGKVAVHDGKKGQVILSKGALINGPVIATNMIVDGTVNGEINVEERIECRSNSIIRGEVRYKKIHIAEGARIEGRCVQKGSAADKESGGTAVKENGEKAEPFLATRRVDFLRKDPGDK